MHRLCDSREDSTVMLNILNKNNKTYPGSAIGILTSGVEYNLLNVIDSKSGSLKINSAYVCNTGNNLINISIFSSMTNNSGIVSTSYLYSNNIISGNNSVNLISKNRPLYIDLSSQLLYIKYSGIYPSQYYLSYDLINEQTATTGNIFELWFDNIKPINSLNSITSGSLYELSFNVYSSNGSGMHLAVSGNSGLISGCFSSATGCFVPNGYKYTLSGLASNQNIFALATIYISGSSANIDGKATLSRSWSIV